MTCADRDVRLLSLIEDLEGAPSFSGDKLFKAPFAALRSFEICVAGRERGALSFYDRAVLDLVFQVGSLR